MALIDLGRTSSARRSARVSVAVLRALVASAAAWVVFVNVWGAFGPSYANLVRVPWTQHVASVPVVGGPGLGQRVAALQANAAQQTGQDRYGAVEPNLFPWTDATSGTKDLFTGLPPVEYGFGNTRMSLWGAGLADRASLAAPVLAWALLALAVLWLLWRLVGSVAADDVFTRANARRVAWIGVLVAAGGSALQLGTYWLDAGIVARSAADGILQPAFGFSFLPLWVGLAVVALAEVFRQGVRLRDDVEGLV